uniref:XPA C-terminal domain-containing protein n=1 Tax=Aureoumbra lagunensis TaxID=44058 RepID=A0A7S3K4R0_9STRA|mmetsp:Transcript_18081/g.27270  ORF Transcript_18081/g.27270 Transcript_18081/m.27270 type:complete len:180 (+) Transcript_18081:78-617(+)
METPPSKQEERNSKLELTPEQRKRIAQNRLQAEQRRRLHDAKIQQAKREEGCRECGNIQIDEAIKKWFGIHVCNTHRQSRDFELLTATDATKEYLLPKSTLKVLPSMNKLNPRGFAHPMKLYLRMHLESAAEARWGSEEKIEEEKAKRRRAAWERNYKGASQCFDDDEIPYKKKKDSSD